MIAALRREIAWWERARADKLPASAVGGKRITTRRPPRAKRILAPESETEKRAAWGDR